jgi:hypothetical protein
VSLDRIVGHQFRVTVEDKHHVEGGHTYSVITHVKGTEAHLECESNRVEENTSLSQCSPSLIPSIPPSLNHSISHSLDHSATQDGSANKPPEADMENANVGRVETPSLNPSATQDDLLFFGKSADGDTFYPLSALAEEFPAVPVGCIREVVRDNVSTSTSIPPKRLVYVIKSKIASKAKFYERKAA